MSVAAALSSDHLNYLIFRYLQEFGHEKTAKAFYRDWNRPTEHEDPESFPFAPEVQRNELIAVAQYGLQHDDVLARVRKSDRRFRWTNIDARESVERQDGVIENGTGSRSLSHTQRKPRLPSHIRSGDDFITPAPKRQRRSDGSEAHVNGDRDAMDVDAVSPSADAEEDNDTASPTVVSEGEGVETAIRYDSMEVGTQTDGIKTTAIHWKIERPGAFVSRCVWNPSIDPKDARCLLAAGDSLCRFYQLPSTFGDDGQEVREPPYYLTLHDSFNHPRLVLTPLSKQITHTDESSLPPGSLITATDWRPDGAAASCAIDGGRKLPDGSNFPSQSLVEYSRVMGSIHFQPGPSLLDPPGMGLHLQYSPNGEYLLLAQMNLERGLVQVWETSKATSGSSSVSREPIAWRVLQQLVHDACWITEDTFLVCGAKGLSSMYRVTEDGKVAEDMNTDEPKQYHGLAEQRSNLVVEEFELDKLRYDPRHKIAVFASKKSKQLIATLRTAQIDKKPESNYVIPISDRLTDLSFQPWSQTQSASVSPEDQAKPTYLAAAFENGMCHVYGIESTEFGIQNPTETLLSLIDGPALALAWSPNGQHLAVCGTDVVQIWHIDALRRKNVNRHSAEAMVTWRRPQEPKPLLNGSHENGQEATISEPSLSWSADGERLAFAIDQHIAIIRFRPPLNAGIALNIEVNGRPTP